MTQLHALLPALSFAVLVQDDEIGLRRRCRPFAEFTLRDRELLAHFNEFLTLPYLHRLKVAA